MDSHSYWRTGPEAAARLRWPGGRWTSVDGAPASLNSAGRPARDRAPTAGVIGKLTAKVVEGHGRWRTPADGARQVSERGGRPRPVLEDSDLTTD